jgi:hypothetical protein
MGNLGLGLRRVTQGYAGLQYRVTGVERKRGQVIDIYRKEEE